MTPIEIVLSIISLGSVTATILLMGSVARLRADLDRFEEDAWDRMSCIERSYWEQEETDPGSRFQ